MTLTTFLQLIWRRRWVVLLVTLMTLAVAAVGTHLMPRTYASTATLRVLTSSTGMGASERYDIGHADRLMRTYAEIATSAPLMNDLHAALGGVSPRIEVEIVSVTELMRITAYSQRPEIATEAANVLAQLLIDWRADTFDSDQQTAAQILGEQLVRVEADLEEARGEFATLVDELPDGDERITLLNRNIGLKEQLYASLLTQYEEARIADTLRANQISLSVPAARPTTPASPNIALNLILGGMIGLVGGAGLAFAFDSLDTRLYTIEQIESVTNLDVLGRIPVMRKDRRGLLTEDDSPEAQSYRRLRNHLFAHEDMTDSRSRTLLVTSAEPREGKSTIVANLAYTIAQSGLRVIVIDCDMRRPRQHTLFGRANRSGLSTILRRKQKITTDMKIGQAEGVHLITSGRPPKNPDAMLSSDTMIALLKYCARQFDVVLLDSPALLAVADAASLIPLVDGVLLVIRSAQKREVVESLCRQMANTNLIGVIVNRVKPDKSLRYYHYYQKENE